MRKSEKIRKAMGITALAYQNCIDAHYQMWCSKYAELFRLPLAAMVADDHIQNWYRDQWLKTVEFPFYMKYRDYLEAEIEGGGVLQDFFLEYPDTIESVWPQTLFDNLKKRTKRTKPPVKQ